MWFVLSCHYRKSHVEADELDKVLAYFCILAAVFMLHIINVKYGY